MPETKALIDALKELKSGREVQPEIEFMGKVKRASDVGVFVWPTDTADLDSIASVQPDALDLGDLALRCLSHFRQQHTKTKGKPMSTVSKDGSPGGQYGLLVGQVDNRYGKNSHRAVLSLLAGEVVTGEYPPGWGLRDIIDWTKAPDDNSAKLAALDEVVTKFKQKWGKQ